MTTPLGLTPKPGTAARLGIRQPPRRPLVLLTVRGSLSTAERERLHQGRSAATHLAVPAVEGAGMSDPRELVDAYAAQAYDTDDNAGYYTDPAGTEVYGIARVNAAPKAFAALRAVLCLHAPAPGDAWCRRCGGDPYPCPMVRAIVDALESA